MQRLGKRVIGHGERVQAMGDRTVLDRCTWLIARATATASWAKTGWGRTTLLRILRGELAPDSGTVKVGQTVKFAMLSPAAAGAQPVC